jgi:hypothetical protein
MGPDGNFPDFKNGMYLGGHVRMRAAAKIAKDSPETEITLVGGYNKLPDPNPDTSNKANDMAQFVRSVIPHANLRLVYSLPCTHHDFIASFNAWRAENIEIEEVGILTNAYHMKRAEAFAHRAAALLGLGSSVRFIPVPAEAVLGEPIETIVGDRQVEYNTRLKSEAQGIIDLNSGNYRDNCLNDNFEVLLPAISRHAKAIMTEDELAQLKHREYVA